MRCDLSLCMLWERRFGRVECALDDGLLSRQDAVYLGRESFIKSSYRGAWFEGGWGIMTDTK